MKTKLEILIASALTGAVLLTAGCGTPYHRYSTSSQRSVTDIHGANASQIRSKIEVDASTLNIDDLMKANREYSTYIAFKSKYSSDSESIISNLNKGNYSEAGKQIKTLGKRLENDSNPYAREYFWKIKNFSYTQTTTWKIRQQHKGAHYVLGIPLRQDVFGTQNHDSTFTETESYRVCPFRGTKVKLR